MMHWSFTSWLVALFARRIGLFSCIIALSCCISSRAWALTSVPMCGEHAETIAAPPISRPAKDVPLSCERKAAPSAVDSAPGKAPSPPSTSLEAAPRLPPIVYRFGPVPRTRVPLEANTKGELAGYTRQLERPPRSDQARVF